MNQSDQLDQFGADFAKVQGDDAFVGVMKDASAGTYGGKKFYFATLKACLETSLPVLTKHGFSVLQWPETNEDGSVCVTTMLLHKSGQFISAGVSMKPGDIPQGKGPQAVGSCISYARRYGLASAVGLFQEDDDAGAAVGDPRLGGKRTSKNTTTTLQKPQAKTAPAASVRDHSEVQDAVEKFRASKLPLSDQEVVEIVTVATSADEAIAALGKLWLSKASAKDVTEATATAKQTMKRPRKKGRQVQPPLSVKS
jgi:hypothetical protein